jgi:hypothetical protein
MAAPASNATSFSAAERLEVRTPTVLTELEVEGGLCTVYLARNPAAPQEDPILHYHQSSDDTAEPYQFMLPSNTEELVKVRGESGLCFAMLNESPRIALKPLKRSGQVLKPTVCCYSVPPQQSDDSRMDSQRENHQQM